MPLPFERFIASRYLRHAQGREEGRRFVRFITYVAIGGVAVGVAALLLALSIVRGFSNEIQAKIIGFGAHVQVESLQDAPIENADAIRSTIAGWEGVQQVDPAIQEFALLRRSAAEIDGVILWGVETAPQFLQESVLTGTADLSRGESGMARVVIGADLARLLNASVGETVTVFSLRRGSDEAAVPSSPRIRQFEVAGIYETFLQNFDELYVLLDIGEARELLGYEQGEVTRLDVTLMEPEQAGEMVSAIEQEFGFPVIARSIFEVYRGLFAWVDLQENIIPIVISVIVIVAAFNIIATLMMLVLEKTREIGVLGSLGASGASLRRIFLLLGLLIGGFGITIGACIALLTAMVQERFGIIPLPADAYYLDQAPIELSLLDFVLVPAVTLVLCLLAAYIPARIASQIQPVRAIRLQ